MNGFESVLVTLAALLPIVNPLGTAPIFLAMSADLPAQARHHLATVVARNAFLLLAAALLFGSYVLQFFGISLAVVRVAGGMVLVSAGWRLLHAGHAEDERPAVVDAWERELARRSFYPLTFPLTVGPGSISIAITLGARSPGNVASIAANLVADMIGVVVIALTIYLSYRFASKLIAWLGETGTNVFLRLSAFILLCVGVSILWGGMLGLLADVQ
jgi:multiple antibiotic resistance protein